MKKTERRNGSSVRRDYYTLIIGIAFIGTMIFRISLGHMIGDKGLACYGTAYEIFIVLAGTLSYGLSEAVATLVRYRMKREQYKSAQKVLSGALFLGGGLGLLLSLLIGIFGHIIATYTMKMPLAGLAISVMAISIFFFILTGVFRGYFHGNGSRVPAMHSQILQTVILFACGLIFGSIFCDYGVKVSDLLQNEDYTSAYGAMGAAVGLLISSILCFLHMLVLYLIFRGNIKRQMSREIQKNLDSRFHVFHMLIGTGAFYFLYYFFFHGQTLAGELILARFTENTGDIFAQWGAYYGKVLAVIGIFCGILNIGCIPSARRIAVLQDKEEYRLAKEKMGILIHQCTALSVPITVFLAVFSENLLNILFGGNNQQAALWMQLGSIMIIFYTFSIVFMEMLIRNRRLVHVVGICAVAFLAQAALSVVLVKSTGMGMLALAVAGILFYVIITAGGFLFTGSKMQYTQEWIRSFLMTLLAAAVSGVIAMLLNKAFAGLIGELISLIVCLVVGIIVYMVLLVVTRAFQAEELEKMPGGWILIRLAELFHFI